MVERLRQRVAKLPLSSAWRVVLFARREFRSGIGGFTVFIICIALGVASITGVGALTDAMLEGFKRQGQILLGGDVTAKRRHKRASDDERSFFSKLGRLSETATMRSMARRVDGSDQALVEVKAVDHAYPLIGTVQLALDGDFSTAIRATGSAVVQRSLLERLNLKLGDRIKLGDGELKITGIIVEEPDRIGARVAFGPRIMVSHETLASTGLVKPATLIRWRYAIVSPLSDVPTTTLVKRLRTAINENLSGSGFIVRDRLDPSPSVTQVLNRLRQFLTLLGLSALLIGGVGVANSVHNFIAQRRKVIAIYKSVGATNSLVFWIYLTQVMVVAALGTLIGILIGSAAPALAKSTMGDSIPIDLASSFNWKAPFLGLFYGGLVALLFALWPLSLARKVRPAALFRGDVREREGLPDRSVLLSIFVVGAVLLGIAIYATNTVQLGLGVLGGVLALLLLFRLLGSLVAYAARRIPRPGSPELALALSNLGAPGGLSRSVVLSLGTGLSLLVAVALVEASLVSELRDRMPENSPDYFALDLTKHDRSTFVHEIRKISPNAMLEIAPMLRGRIISLKGTPAAKAKVAPEAKWVLRGDRGLTFDSFVPKGSRLVSGKWWPKDYKGEPLVSFEADLARQIGLDVGDTLTVNILGRNVKARVANLREVEWERLSINFVMVFSPNTLQSAPYNLLATVKFPSPTPAGIKAQAARAVGQKLSYVTMINVADAIVAFGAVFAKVMIAIEIAASITLIAGALVLAGAMATAQRRRIIQAVILKCIGATRRRLILSHLFEYGLLSLIAAILALILGSIAAWYITSEVVDVPFIFSWVAVIGAVSISVALILFIGAIATWRVLNSKPVPVLRGL